MVSTRWLATKPLGTICLYTKLLPSQRLLMCTVITAYFQTRSCSLFVGVGFSKSGPHPYTTSALPLSHGPGPLPSLPPPPQEIWQWTLQAEHGRQNWAPYIDLLCVCVCMCVRVCVCVCVCVRAHVHVPAESAQTAEIFPSRQSVFEARAGSLAQSHQRSILKVLSSDQRWLRGHSHKVWPCISV